MLSAKRELLLFLVVYMFTQHAATGQAPIEVIMPEARRMPVYRLINDPFRALQERGNVKGQPQMARFAPAPGRCQPAKSKAGRPCNAHRSSPRFFHICFLTLFSLSLIKATICSQASCFT